MGSCAPGRHFERAQKRECERESERPGRAAMMHRCVLFEQPLRGQISGVLLTQVMILGVLEPSDVCSFVRYGSQLANLSS